jgi:hypothetical protein
MGRLGLGRQRGKFSLQSVYNEQNEEIYQTVSGVLRNQLPVHQPGDFISQNASHSLRLTISTPLRITELGKVCHHLDFPLLLRNILRRASLLAEIHTPQKWPLDYSTILANTSRIETKSTQLRWWDWERYSNRQQRRMQMGGLVGELKLHGDLAAYWPLLKLGEYIHVGKNTTFGMGKMTIYDESEDTHTGP